MTLLTLFYYIISCTFLLLHFIKFSITPAFIFVAMQLLMFNGIIFSGYQGAYVEKLSFIYLIALVLFIFGVFTTNCIHKNKIKFKNISDENPTKYQYFIIFSLIVLSIIVCLWFFSKAGINIFIESLKSFLSGENKSFSENRKNFIDITGTGYVYQFRTIILPMLNIYLLLGQNNKRYKKYGFILLPFTIIFLLGTGQRNAFVFILLMTFLYIIFLHKYFGYKISKGKLIFGATISIIFLCVLTITNGRVSDDSQNIFTGALISLIDRVVGINSRSALHAFRYIETQNTAWGYDWLMMLADILPGKSGYTSVASITYQILYGTYRGTEPPCIWGSTWYNWSWFGIIIMPNLLGIIYQNVYYKFIRKRKTTLNLLFYTGLCTFLGMWFCESPMVLFNNGVVTILLMSALILNNPFKYRINKILI